MDQFNFIVNGTGTVSDTPANKDVTVKFERIHEMAQMPEKAHESDAAFDLTAVYFEKKDFAVLAHTGLKLQIPVGYEAQIRPRSGLALKGVTVVNSPGTIDAGYRGEICVILGTCTGQPPFLPEPHNRTAKIGNAEFNVGDRIAQLVIQPVLSVQMEEVQSVDSNTDRGIGGFGSTGV
jgi:dUTP pyrophosphatase